MEAVLRHLLILPGIERLGIVSGRCLTGTEMDIRLNLAADTRYQIKNSNLVAL